MSISLKPYSEYKNTGTSWLGRIPKHWEVRRFKYLLHEINDRSQDGLERLLSVSQYTGVTPRLSRNGDEAPVTRAASLVGYKIVCPDDLVVNIMLAWNGSLGVSRFAGIVSPAYCVYRFDPEVEPWYYHNLLRSPLYKGRIKVDSTGVVDSRLRLYSDDLYNVEAIVPPSEEQVTVARFVAVFGQQVDRLIRTKQRLIELLNEQMQAIIHRAVTRGLDPNVRFKPSGIDWLGNVPEHWDIPLAGRCLHTIEQGWSPTAAEGEIIEEQWAVLTLSAVKKGIFNAKAIKPIPLSAKVPNSIEVHDGNFLLTRSNTRSLVGDVCVVEGVRPRTILCDLIYRLRLDKNSLLPRFLMYLLLSGFGRAQIESDARGSSHTMVKLGQGHIKRWRILVPPLNEQQRIVENLDLECGKLGDATSRIGYEIDLLREYRTRLIADVVTGKLDVRKVELPALDEIEEPEDLEAEEDAEVETLDDLEENDG